jgi:hypothetical protein
MGVALATRSVQWERVTRGRDQSLKSFIFGGSRDSSVGIATGWTARLRFPAVQDFSVHSFQTDSGAHPATYPMRIGGSFPGGNAAGA